MGTHLDQLKTRHAVPVKSSDRRGRNDQVGPASRPATRPSANSDLTQSLELGHRSNMFEELTQSLPVGFQYRRQQTTPVAFSPGSMSTEHELEASFGQSSVMSPLATSEAASRMGNEGYLQEQQQRAVSPSEMEQFSEKTGEEEQPTSPKATDVVHGRPETSPSIVSTNVSPVPVQVPVTSPTPSSATRSVSPKRTAEQWIVRTLADVHIFEGEEEQARYRRYVWHLFTISVFYGLPAFQLILTYQQLLHITGNQDICYYNYLCSRQLGVLRSVTETISKLVSIPSVN